MTGATEGEKRVVCAGELRSVHSQSTGEGWLLPPNNSRETSRFSRLFVTADEICSQEAPLDRLLTRLEIHFFVPLSLPLSFR